MEFAILGPLEVRRNGDPIALTGGKQRAVLAVLLAAGNRPVTPDALAMAIWGTEVPASAVNAVHAHVSRLRGLLNTPELIVTVRAGYQLRVGRPDVDALRLEDLLRAA